MLPGVLQKMLISYEEEEVPDPYYGGPSGFDHVFDMLLAIALCGGALAILLIVIRKLVFSFVLLAPSPDRQSMPRVLLQGEPVPYGVGIAVGGIWLGMKLPLLGYGMNPF